MEGLAGKIAVVTGAGRGIGRACALAFVAAGAEVIAVARTQSDLDSLSTETSGRITTWRDDVTTESFFARIEALQRLDILLNNAGMNRPMLISDVDSNTLDAMIDLNVRAMYRTSQSAARVMLRAGHGGSIIHMSSQMGHVGSSQRTVYCMTKHAMEGLTKAMAVELGSAGIRVNSVAPTFIETDLTRSMLQDPVFLNWVLDSIPLGRLGKPADVVGAILFLASPASGLMTGASLKVDGGWTAR